MNQLTPTLRSITWIRPRTLARGHEMRTRLDCCLWPDERHADRPPLCPAGTEGYEIASARPLHRAAIEAPGTTRSAVPRRMSAAPTICHGDGPGVLCGNGVWGVRPIRRQGRARRGRVVLDL